MQRFILWSSLGNRFSWALVALAILGACSASASGTPGPPSPRLKAPGSDQTVAGGFNLELVTKVEAPTALAFTPDGRMLVTTQLGKLFAWENGNASLVLDLSTSTCTRIEQGMLGVAVDPDFAANGSIYVFHTARRADGCVNRVSKFALGGSPTASDEQVLIDGIPSPKGNHNAGDLNFGPDGLLYVSTGDGGCDYEGAGCNGKNDASRDRNVLLGKILRITVDGDAPAGNPFTGPDSDSCRHTGRTAPGRVCRETFAWGLRNPYRFAFDPGDPGGRFYINDVGQDTWEEIDEGIAGADYGWNAREGHCANGSATECSDAPAAFTDPVFDYAGERRGGCHAITGGAFVPPGIWPDPYGGQYLFGDFGCGAIFRLVEDGTGEKRAEPFARVPSGFGVVHLEFGPFGATQALYFTSYENGGAVYRISHAGSG